MMAAISGAREGAGLPISCHVRVRVMDCLMMVMMMIMDCLMMVMVMIMDCLMVVMVMIMVCSMMIMAIIDDQDHDHSLHHLLSNDFQCKV